MNLTQQQRDAILRNASPDWQSLERPLALTERGWGQINPQTVLEAIEKAVPDAEHPARELLGRMGRHRWSMRATKYGPKESDAQRMTNRAPRVTLKINSREYSLECKQYPQLHLIGVAA